MHHLTLKGLSANKIINTSSTQGQMISFSVFFILLDEMCGHNEKGHQISILESTVSFALPCPKCFVNFGRPVWARLAFRGAGLGEPVCVETQNMNVFLFCSNQIQNFFARPIFFGMISKIFLRKQTLRSNERKTSHTGANIPGVSTC